MRARKQRDSARRDLRLRVNPAFLRVPGNFCNKCRRKYDDRVYDVAGSVTCRAEWRSRARRDLSLRIHSALTYDTRRPARSPRELLFGPIASGKERKKREKERRRERERGGGEPPGTTVIAVRARASHKSVISPITTRGLYGVTRS